MLFYKNTFLPALINNHQYVVVEYYDNHFITVVHFTDTELSDVVKFHEERCRDFKFFQIQVRELCYTYDHVFPVFKKMTKDLINLGIDENRIKFIINYHSYWITKDLLKSELGVNVCLLKVRWFEVDAVIKHSFRYIIDNTDTIDDFNYQKHQTINTLTKFDKKYLALFGKPIKYFRIATLVEMIDNGMIDESISTALVNESGAKIIVDTLKNRLDEVKMTKALKRVMGSADNIKVENSDTIGSHYPGYPYDVSLYEDTFVSIVSECHGSVKQEGWINNQDFWITEKTTRVFKNFHPFVMLSTDGFLKRLRDEMGYMTFHEIVDESYDTERDGDLKIKLALNSAKGLVENYKDPRIRDIVTHNYFHQQKVAKDELKKIDDFIFNKYRGTVKTKLI